MKKVTTFSVIICTFFLLMIGYYLGISRGGGSIIRNICEQVHDQILDTTHGTNESIKEVVQDDIPTERIFHNVQFIITNERFCQDRYFDILIYVFSTVGHFAQRLAIRATWGNSTVLKDDLKLVYVVGRASSKDMQKLIEAESKKFNDIIQGDIDDTYYGLVNKSITTWNWIRMYCKTAKVFMKTDDDVALDIERIVKSVQPYINKPRHLMCYLMTPVPVDRNEKSRYYISHDEYPDKFYPPFCLGWAFLYTRDIVEEMCRYMLQTEVFKLADTWTTGMVMKKVQNLTKIQLRDLIEVTAPHRAVLHKIPPSSMKEATSKVIGMRRN